MSEVRSLVGFLILACFPAFAQNANWGQLITAARQYHGQGEYQRELTAAQESLRIAGAQFGAESRQAAVSANQVAMALKGLNRLADAEPFYRRALAIDQKLLGPEDPETASMLSNLGVLYWDMGRLAEARDLLVRSLAIREKALGPNHPDTANSAGNLAAVSLDQGRYAETEALERRALAVDEKSLGPEHAGVANDLLILGQACYHQRKYKDTEPLYIRALSIHLKLHGNEHPQVASDLNLLGALYTAEARYQLAGATYQRALAIREKALGPENPSVAATLTGMAQLHQEEGQKAEAEALYKRALAIDEKALGPEDLQVASILNGLGSLYMDLVQVPAAVPLFQRALAIHEKILGPADPRVAADMSRLAEVYAAGNHAADAGPLYERVIAFYEKTAGAGSSSLAGPLLSLATLRQRQARWAEAEALGKRGLAILEATAGPNHPDTRTALANLAITYYGSGRAELAAPYFDRELAILTRQVESSFTFMTERQRLQFLKVAPGAYYLFFSFALANRERAPALGGKMYDVLLWEKGLVASNSATLRARILDSGDRDAVALFDQLAAKRSELSAMASTPAEDAAQWHKTMAQLDQDSSSIEAELVKRSTAMAEGKALARVTWRDVQKGLKPDEAAVEYVCFQIHDGGGWSQVWDYAAVVLTPSAPPKMVLLGDARKLDSEAGAAYRADLGRSRGVSIEESKPAPQAAASGGMSAAYTAFWKPLEAALGNAKRVYVSADGILNQVPVGLFSDSAGKLLLEKYDLRVVNSTKDLLRPQHTAGSKAAIVVGNPAFAQTGTGALPPLPATEAEVQAVTLALKGSGWPVSLYTGSSASKDVMGKARSPRLVHLATHGFFLPATAAVSDPMLRSGLYFAGAEMLTAYEASQLHLQGTELVVLSACETGLGQQANGEGVFGLRRGLQEAGAESVLMSMWSVPDHETQELMTLFYQQWLGGLDAHEALRRAQLKERETVRARYGRDLPYYWGAFVLVGR